MKRNILIIVVIVLVLALVGLVLKTKVFSGPTLAALKVTANPKATVFIDGTQVGLTPFFDDKIKSGEHTIKLVPENAETSGSIEKNVNLVSTALTVVDFTFGTKSSEMTGQILSLEKITSRDKAALSIISDPDQAVVKVNGDPKGFAPVLLEDLDPGNYQLSISSPGYEERNITNANLIAGFKLKVEVKLAQKLEGFEEATSSGETEEVSPTPTPTGSVKPTPTPTKGKTSPTPTPTIKAGVTGTPTTTGETPAKPYVKIKETPTGFLRVRQSPSTTAEELAQVDPGQMFPYLDEQQSGWYKIEYETDKEGWVSGVYVDLVK